MADDNPLALVGFTKSKLAKNATKYNHTAADYDNKSLISHHSDQKNKKFFKMLEQVNVGVKLGSKKNKNQKGSKDPKMSINHNNTSLITNVLDTDAVSDNTSAF